MKKLLIGTTLAAVAMFFWGFVFWGINPIPWTIIAAAPDEVALSRAVPTCYPTPQPRPRRRR